MQGRAPLDKVFDAIEESIIDAPDEEIMADILAEGEDPAMLLQRGRELLLTVVRRFEDGA